MFSFFSPFPFLRILGLWVIGLLISPLGLILLAPVLWLSSPTRRWICGLLLIGLAVARISQLSAEFTHHLPKHDAFVFQVNQTTVRGPSSWKIQAKIISVRHGKQWERVHALANLFIPVKGAAPRFGQVFHVYGSLKPIREPLLPGAFDWRRYYALQGIYSTAFVPIQGLKLLKDASGTPSIFERMRAQASSYLHQALPNGVHRNVADAMFLGMGSTIDFETRQSYAALGAIHILSVSGMHVGLLYLGLQFLLGFLLRFRPWGPRFYFGLIMLVLWSYAALSGFSAPVLRSAWMFSVLLFAQIFRLRTHPVNVWAFSGFVLLVIQPMDLFQVGFQLSYAAVLGLILFQRPLASLWSPKYWLLKQSWELTCVAISAQVLTWPLIIYYFHQFPNPLYFFLLNPLLVLLSTLTLGVGFIFLILAPMMSYFPMAFSSLGHLVLLSFELLHGLMFATTDRFQTVISFIRLNLVELAAYYVGLGLLWHWWAFRKVWGLYLAAFLLAGILIHRMGEPLHREAYLSIADKQVVFLSMQGLRGQSYGGATQAWLQSNAGAWWANNQVVDTLTRKWPNGSFQWEYQGMEFVYLTKPGVHRNANNSHLILSAELDLRDPRFLKSWQGSTWYFIRKPSVYRLSKLKPFWPKKVYYLAEQAAVHFP
ncbi:ComEC/Rec2 family competence protein [Aquirufa regiilacus]